MIIYEKCRKFWKLHEHAFERSCFLHCLEAWCSVKSQARIVDVAISDDMKPRGLIKVNGTFKIFGLASFSWLSGRCNVHNEYSEIVKLVIMMFLICHVECHKFHVIFRSYFPV